MPALPADLELSERRGRRIERLLKASGLPADKRLATLEQEKLPAKVRRQLPALCEGSIVERAENLLAFGLPGRGKTHVVSAIGHELVQRGYEVPFVPAVLLVQRLLEECPPHQQHGVFAVGPNLQGRDDDGGGH